MRVRSVDARSVRTERVVHGSSERVGLVARNVDVGGFEQHEIGDVCVQMDWIGTQPEFACAHIAIDERGDRGDRPVRAGGQGRVPEGMEG